MKTIKKALTVLDSFTSEKPSLGITELADSLSLPKTTVHEIVTAFKEGGYLDFNPRTKKYNLGYKLLELSSRISHHQNLKDLCRPFMKDLQNLVDEDISLSIPSGSNRLCISIVRGPQFVRQNITLGMTVPLHCGAGGKCLLAFMGDSELALILKNEVLEKFTHHTIVEKNILFKELKGIRANGFAESKGEFFMEAAAFSFPLFSFEERIIAVLTIHSTVSRISAEKQQSFIQHGLEISAAVNKLLGNLNDIF